MKENMTSYKESPHEKAEKTSMDKVHHMSKSEMSHNEIMMKGHDGGFYGHMKVGKKEKIHGGY